MSLRTIVLTAILLVLGTKFGWDFLTSEKFQEFGDKKGAQWTCHVNIWLGGLYEVLSEYSQAIDTYDRTIARCPESKPAEKSLFQKAACLEHSGLPLDAMEVYLDYVELYPKGDKVRLANRAINRIKASR